MRKAVPAGTIVALAMFVACILLGCGGSSSSPPTKAAYLKQVSKVCQEGANRYNRFVGATLARFQQKGATDKLKEESMLELQGPYEEVTEQLSELTPPKGGEPKVKALIRGREQVAIRLGKDPLGAYEHEPFGKAEAPARAIGLTQCAL